MVVVAVIGTPGVKIGYARFSSRAYPLLSKGIPDISGRHTRYRASLCGGVGGVDGGKNETLSEIK